MNNKQKEIIVPMSYYYKGSSCIYVKIVETDDGLNIYSNYEEPIAEVYSGYGLLTELKKICDGVYS